MPLTMRCIKFVCLVAAIIPPMAASVSLASILGSKPTARILRAFKDELHFKDVKSIEVLPPSVLLQGRYSQQRIVVMAHFLDGTRRDVSSLATVIAANNRIAKIKGNAVHPQADGKTNLHITFGQLRIATPVLVEGMSKFQPISFVNEVTPIFAQIGCSMGTCHGAQQGKGGFKLSLRGYAPEIDYLSITRQLGGRRISREAPERSLLLRKPLMEVPHRGGKVLVKGSRDYNVILNWIRQGAVGPSGKEPALTKLDILPGNCEMKPGEKQRLLVRATFDDNHSEDVTHHTQFASNDMAVASVDESGVVTQMRAGETAITAKYMSRLAAVRFLSPFDQKINKTAFNIRYNYVDDMVHSKLKQLHIDPSPICTDEEFLRRAYIDAIGTLPAPDEAVAFLNDPSPMKREKLIDALLLRPEFGQVWALKFGDLFVLRKEYMHRKYAMVFQQWLSEQFNSNRSWDKIAIDILTASGELSQNRAGYFYVSRSPQKPGEGNWIRHPENTAEMVGTVFMGNRMQCAKCHNHPTEKYTQDDYYHFTALFQQVTGPGASDEGVPITLKATANGDVRQPRTNELMSARPLDRSDLGFVKEEDRRIKFAAWMVKQDDFARNIVNRFWARCFGSGIIDPVDDIRSTNPPRNEALIDALSRDLRSHNFDLKYLLKTIMMSRTYQSSAIATKTNAIDTKLFSHYMAKRLPAEELADAVCQVTGVPDHFQGLPVGTRAIELADTEIPSIMLDTFGRPTRVQPLESERTCSPAISQALALLNSELVQQKIKSGDCLLNPWIKDKKTNEQIIEQIFLSALARRPRPKEMAALVGLVAQTPKREEGLQDVMWAVLNSKEFIFNH